MVKCLYCGKIITSQVINHEKETYCSKFQLQNCGILINNIYYNFIFCTNCDLEYDRNLQDDRIEWLLDRIDWINDYNLHEDYLEDDYSFIK